MPLPIGKIQVKMLQHAYHCVELREQKLVMSITLNLKMWIYALFPK